MRTFAPLWSGIVDSSIWDEPDYVVKVFLTMMALKDADQICRLNTYQLATRARKSELEVIDALRILSSPDTRRIGEQEFEGRRVQAVEEGFLLLNGVKYTKMMSEEMARRRNARAQAAYRERQRKKFNKSGPLPGEATFCKTGEMPHEYR
jgi:hypothetical protein